MLVDFQDSNEVEDVTIDYFLSFYFQFLQLSAGDHSFAELLKVSIFRTILINRSGSSSCDFSLSQLKSSKAKGRGLHPGSAVKPIKGYFRPGFSPGSLRHLFILHVILFFKIFKVIKISKIVRIFVLGIISDESGFLR